MKNQLKKILLLAVLVVFVFALTSCDFEERFGIFEVTFDYGDGRKETVKSNNYRIEPPSNPQRDGYKFNDWYLKDGSGGEPMVWLFNAYAVTQDMTLHADWTKVRDSSWENGWWDDITYDETTLKFMMTKCSNNQELKSGCERYLAGEATKNEYIDDLVAQRNKVAENYANVDIKYDYYDDIADTFGFSRAHTKISADINNGGDEAPDMYCNFMTDMLLCSLKGNFANLNTIEAKYGKNYFDLSSDGYMADLMRSTTLSRGKVYVIASDYFIDLIRAFFVVPVSVKLFNEVATEAGLEDLSGDGVVDINDFFYEVEKGEWTYARLMKYCELVYEDSNVEGGKVGQEDITDTLGFALGVNGLPAAGLLYSSSAVIIQKYWDNGNCTYNYVYPDTNQKLFDIVGAIDAMMDTVGIMAADDKDAKTVGLQGTEEKALLGIRRQFTGNKMLFGGIILVGSLEYKVYQDMKDGESGGFGVVPVPVYQAGDKYLTQIHVVGRAGGIRANTAKFSACSAFLQYQSENSTKILNDYYDYNLTAAANSSLDGNVRMLQYIRQNVRTSFDKLFEDAIGFFFDNGDSINQDNRLHARLCNTRFEYASLIGSEYDNELKTKKDNLALLVLEYEKLPA